MFKTIWRNAQLLLLAFVLTACGKSSELTWTEDVKLPDGRVITLKRWVEFKGGSSHLGDPSTESQQTFEFKHPETGEIVRWQNTMEQGTLRTLALWLDQGKPMLLLEPAYMGDLRKFKCPNPPYFLYEYLTDRWIGKPLSQISVKSIRANLTFSLVDRREYILRNKHLSAEETSASYTALNGVLPVPYVINFEGMPEQTSKEETCDRSFNYLIDQEGK